MSKFQVGQPVWAIKQSNGEWDAGVIVAFHSYWQAYSPNDPVWEVSIPGAPTLMYDDRPIGVPESRLRPRDPDQHIPATDDIDLSMSLEAV